MQSFSILGEPVVKFCEPLVLIQQKNSCHVFYMHHKCKRAKALIIGLMPSLDCHLDHE